jgi:hypothetical protein
MRSAMIATSTFMRDLQAAAAGKLCPGLPTVSVRSLGTPFG